MVVNHLSSGSGLAPNISLEHLLKGFSWKKFHKGLKKRNPEYFDKVIASVQHFIEGMCGDCNTKIDHDYLNGEPVSDCDLNRHLLNYLMRKDREHWENREYSNEEKPRWQWNYVNNMLRTLKRMRNDEAVFLLPDKDVRCAEEFISGLKVPPIDRCYLL